jgi:hypothetical protein
MNPMKQAATQHRHDIAQLKRQLAQLERRRALISRKTLATRPCDESYERRGASVVRLTNYVKASSPTPCTSPWR